MLAGAIAHKVTHLSPDVAELHALALVKNGLSMNEIASESAKTAAITKQRMREVIQDTSSSLEPLRLWACVSEDVRVVMHELFPNASLLLTLGSAGAFTVEHSTGTSKFLLHLQLSLDRQVTLP